MSPDELKSLVRTIPDFPKPDIQFRDITTLLIDGRGFAAAVDALVELARPYGADLIAGIEARGFIFSAPVARALGAGLLPVRKPGKLPGPRIGVDYALEYGTDRLEIHEGACLPGHRVVLVDDLIATGGTALATVSLLRQAGADVPAALFVIDLPELGGAALLNEAGVAAQALMSFEGH
ncbi:adenine phosphoribosyltransferase [Sphingomonas sp.]|jgi:adenine phosphoribosyltransferase|uniref:adenine phosphoribosyltransferase n=1 Tax=Sphingomonas sp. TaxID=28214 RepID=UPI002DBD8D6C|nr:adenine phosphoribosyltransferase [Sphingomonas sp.]HEU4968207.1 adenine phosphoribosyltransferase [Sphingomonas sp.]